MYEPLLWYHGADVVQWVKAHMGGIFSLGRSGGGPADVFALHGYLPEGGKNPVYMRCNPTRGGICFFPNRAYSLYMGPPRQTSLLLLFLHGSSHSVCPSYVSSPQSPWDLPARVGLVMTTPRPPVGSGVGPEAGEEVSDVSAWYESCGKGGSRLTSKS